MQRPAALRSEARARAVGEVDTRIGITCNVKGEFRVRLQSGAWRLLAHDEHYRLKGSARAEIRESEATKIEVRLK